MAYNPATMSFDLPSTDMVYVSGLPEGVTEQDIQEYFGSIGIIKMDKKTKKPKIWLYRDKETGALKGDGTVSYEDPFSAGSAVQWFDNKEWKGSMLSVSLAEQKGGGGGGGGGGRGGYGGGGGGGRGGYGGGGGGEGGYGGGGGGGGGGGAGRAGDWTCPSCGNNCFAFRSSCNRCNTAKPGGGGDGGGGGGGGYGGGGPGHGGGGGGGGGGGRAGDWTCPSCGNNCFAFRSSCNRCNTAKPGGGGGGGYGDGASGMPMQEPVQAPFPMPPEMHPPAMHADPMGVPDAGFGTGPREGGPPPGPPNVMSNQGNGAPGPAGYGGEPAGKKKVVAAPQGPLGLFAPEDWACPSCGNMNWARRKSCNLCGATKPGMLDMKREGQAGGFKELDEQELEEAKKRRQEFESQDMYDEFGRLKKQFRGGQDRREREAAALARLHGAYGGVKSIVLDEEALKAKAAAAPAAEAPTHNPAPSASTAGGRGRGGDRERERDRHDDRGGRDDRGGGRRDDYRRDDRERDRRDDRDRDRGRDFDRRR